MPVFDYIAPTTEYDLWLTTQRFDHQIFPSQSCVLNFAQIYRDGHSEETVRDQFPITFLHPVTPSRSVPPLSKKCEVTQMFGRVLRVAKSNLSSDPSQPPSLLAIQITQSQTKTFFPFLISVMNC